MSQITISINYSKTFILEQNEIFEMLRAHYFAENTIHLTKIKKERNQNSNYMGTSFIYKQMVFNMIYDNFENSENNTAKEKIFNLIEWMASKIDNINKLLIPISKEDIENLNNITIDKRISRSKKNSFLNITNKIYKEEEISVNQIKEIFIFINNVRNNFFHGTKKAQAALENGQNKRLEIYSKFLSNLAYNFFNILSNDGVELLDSSILHDDLKENLGLLTR